MPDLDPGADDELDSPPGADRTPPGGAAGVLTITPPDKPNADAPKPEGAGPPPKPDAPADAAAEPELARARKEAARYRTELRAAQSQLAERDAALETTKAGLSAELNAAQTERDSLRAELRDIRYRAAVTDAITAADALRPAKLLRLVDPEAVKVAEDTGQPDPRSLAAAVERLRAEYPEEFRDTARLLGGDAGAGRAGGAAAASGDMNRMFRAALGR